jgi:hypothetical protein
MKLKQYIEILQKFNDDNPHLSEVEVCITQDGYYAQGEFADIYDEPKFKVKSSFNVEYNPYNYNTKTTKVTKQFVILGNSTQN